MHVCANNSVVLRQAHSLFQSEFSIQCDLVHLVSISSILSFPYGQPVAAYFFFLVFTSIPPFIFRSVMCFKTLPMQDVTNQINLVSFYSIFLSSLTVCNTSFLPRSVQLIFSFSITTFRNFLDISDLLY